MTVKSESGAVPPRISILMPCRNGERYIVEAVESLQRQAYPNLEHLVLDASSVDGTLALLARYPATVISEPDKGAHDALNKGITRASGDIIGFLAVDDICPDGTLKAIGRMFAERPEIDVIVGHSLVFEDDNNGGRRWLFARTHSKGDGLWLPELTFGVPGFFGCFFRRRVFDIVGKFNLSYKFAGDRHFLMRVVLQKMKSVRIDRPTIYYRMHSSSQTINRQMRNLLPLSAEYVRMSRELADAPDTDPPARRIFLAWHAFESAKLTVRMLLRGRIAEALNNFTQLCQNNPLWPAVLVRGLMLRHAVAGLDRNGGRLAAGGDIDQRAQSRSDISDFDHS
jgi:hypothetical protein